MVNGKGTETTADYNKTMKAMFSLQLQFVYIYFSSNPDTAQQLPLTNINTTHMHTASISNMQKYCVEVAKISQSVFKTVKPE
jgi:hypothetical protein